MSGQPSIKSDVQGAESVQDALRRVLVAEDEHLLAMSLRADLEALGYAVIGPVGTGRQALELADAQKPDLALLDLRMPEIDGLQAADVIYRRYGVPVVIVSAHSEQEHVAACAELGVFGYLIKPITRDDLRVTLAVAWSRFNEHRSLHNEVEHLNHKIEERKLIERAKGLLMQHEGLNEPDAMRRLQKMARNSRQNMATVAREIIASHAPPKPG